MKILVLKEDNSLLLRAFKARNDEFYTQTEDIENEVIHYEKELENKVIYCNCDSINSNFLYYFALNFNRFKIKKLLVSGLNSIGIEIDRIKEDRFNKTELKRLIQKNRKNLSERESVMIDNLMIKMRLFRLNKDEDREIGEYRSRDCLKLLDRADIVITNPPFSLFRDFFTLLSKEYDKKFLIIGNQTGAAYNCVFPYFKSNKVRFGLTWARKFDTDRKEVVHVNTEWFTNLRADKYPEKLELTKSYNSKDYPKLDNYDAININKVRDIPKDYRGVMAVPVNFLNKYNPNQFKILGLCKRNQGTKYLTKMYGDSKFDAQATLKEKGELKRLFIRVLIKRV